MKRKTLITLTVRMVVTLIVGSAKAESNGKTDPDFTVDIYNPDKAWNGNTILADNHNRRSPRACGGHCKQRDSLEVCH